MRSTTALLIKEKLQQQKWDFEWDYTKGLMSQNELTTAITGTAGETLESNGVLLTSLSQPENRIAVIPPVTFSKKAVMEITAEFKDIVHSDYGVRWILSDGDKALQVFVNKNYISVEESDSREVYINSVNILPVSLNRQYKVRLEFNVDTGCKVFVDNSLLYNKFAFSKHYITSGNKFYQQDGGATLYKSIKYKFFGGDDE